MSPVREQGGAFAAACRRVAEMIDDALTKKPPALGEEVDEIERAVVRLRDGLIDRLRAATPGNGTSELRAALDRVNTALSLVVGVEYPLGGIHRQLLEQARDTLRAVPAEG